MDKEKFIEGHRLIRNFKREREQNKEITNFEWKELQLIKKQLTKSIYDLKIEFDKNTDNNEKQQDIFGDVGMFKHYITNIENIERGFKTISEKYEWDK